MRVPRLFIALVFCLCATIAAVSASPRYASSAAASETALQSAGRSPRAPSLRWIFRQQDLLTCRTAAYTLRHLNATLGDKIEIIAVPVGIDENVVRSFLRAERLPIGLSAISEYEMSGRYGDTPPPGLYVLLGDSVVRAFPVGTGRDYPDVQLLERSIQPLLEKSKLPEAVTLPSTPPARSES